MKEELDTNEVIHFALNGVILLLVIIIAFVAYNIFTAAPFTVEPTQITLPVELEKSPLEVENARNTIPANALILTDNTLLEGTDLLIQFDASEEDNALYSITLTQKNALRPLTSVEPSYALNALVTLTLQESSLEEDNIFRIEENNLSFTDANGFAHTIPFYIPLDYVLFGQEYLFDGRVNWITLDFEVDTLTTRDAHGSGPRISEQSYVPDTLNSAKTTQLRGKDNLNVFYNFYVNEKPNRKLWLFLDAQSFNDVYGNASLHFLGTGQESTAPLYSFYYPDILALGLLETDFNYHNAILAVSEGDIANKYFKTYLNTTTNRLFGEEIRGVSFPEEKAYYTKDSFSYALNDVNTVFVSDYGTHYAFKDNSIEVRHPKDAQTTLLTIHALTETIKHSFEVDSVDSKDLSFTFTNNELSRLTDESRSYTYNGAQTSFDVQETLSLHADSFMNSDAVEVRFPEEAFTYTLSLGSGGIPLFENSKKQTPLIVDADDSFKVQWLGESYSVYMIDFLHKQGKRLILVPT